MTYSPEQQACLQRCQALMEASMRNFDGSHDKYHVQRVRKLALNIADTIPNVNKFYVDAAALLHDVYDSKYSQVDSEAQRHVLTELICVPGIEQIDASRIINIAQNISYSKEVAAEVQNCRLPIMDEIATEWACVHDADYLDAIGSIGILRTAAFTGTRNTRLVVQRPGVNASPTEINEFQTSCCQHFYDKLLLLKNRMKTEEGRRMARPRQEMMQTFLEQLKQEVM